MESAKETRKDQAPGIQGRSTYFPYPPDAVPHIIYDPKENEKIIVVGGIHLLTFRYKSLFYKIFTDVCWS